MYMMLKMILLFHQEAESSLKAGVDIRKVIGLEVREDIARFRYIPEDKTAEEFEKIKQKIFETFSKI